MFTAACTWGGKTRAAERSCSVATGGRLNCLNPRGLVHESRRSEPHAAVPIAIPRNTAGRKCSALRVTRIPTTDLASIATVHRHGRLTFFRSGAACLHVPTRLIPEPAKHEAARRRASERHAVGCCEELGGVFVLVGINQN